MKLSTIAAVVGLIILSIVTVQEESTLAGVLAIICGFYLIGKVFHAADIWLGDIDNETDLRES